MAPGIMVSPRGLDRALDRLRARIGEEDGVREGEVDQALRQLLALRRAVEVGDVDQGGRLPLDRLGEVGMAVAQQIDRDAACEIEIARAVLAVEIDPFPAHRPDRRARINGHERRDGHEGLLMRERRPVKSRLSLSKCSLAASIAAGRGRYQRRLSRSRRSMRTRCSRWFTRWRSWTNSRWLMPLWLARWSRWRILAASRRRPCASR